MKIRKHIIAILGIVVMSIGLPIPTQALELAEVDNKEIAIEETSEGVAIGRTVPYYNLTTSGGTWNGTYYKRNGKIVKDSFFCDGTYTYYLQADGTPMKNRLTYHPDGEHIIYFDNKGHEVFDNFQYCADVGYTCYFDTYGYLYKDKITFSNEKVYYLDGDGRMKQNGWFKFANGVDYGYAYSDGTLYTSGFGYDPYGRQVFYHWNGMVARGLITDGVNYYHMDETDGHYLGSFPVATTPKSNEIAVDSVIVYSDFMSIEIGKANSQSAVIQPRNATDKTLIWQSSNTNIATVDKDGIVRGISVGSCTITATSSNGKSASFTAWVWDPSAPFDPQLYLDYAIWYGQSIGLKYTADVGSGMGTPTKYNTSWDTPVIVYAGRPEEKTKAGVRGACDRLKKEGIRDFYPYLEKQADGYYWLYFFY